MIGRNEGPRLMRCLRSVLGDFDPVVYVDSASNDGSPQAARALGADVVALDLSQPFSFGRARNVGARRVLELSPQVRWVQFVDADSEVAPRWCERAVAALAADVTLAALHGRVRERRVRDSLYGHLFELEFEPCTETDDVIGGMAMIRMSALQALGGYAEGMQTFEDHELSFRLRAAGWRIRRLGDDMVIHEAAMTHWRQWWVRERRAGHGRAELVAMHGARAAPEWRRAYASVWFWGAMLPIGAVAAVAAWGAAGLVVLLAYPALLGRVFRRMRRRGLGTADAALFAAGKVLGKFPQVHGVVSFLRRQRGAA